MTRIMTGTPNQSPATAEVSMAKAATKRSTEKAAETAVVAYKALHQDFTCNGFQYAVGKTYELGADPVICNRGFHACENPLDVLNYYDLDSRFARVTVGGKIDRQNGGDSKICGASITIEAELSLPEWIGAAVKWVIDSCKPGENVQAASGDYSKLAASGVSSKLAASGNYSKLAASGNYSQLAASGYYSQLAASGVYSKLAASGDSSKLAASGVSSQLAASGDSSKLAASGDSSKLAASGVSSQLAASGVSSKLEITGADSAAAAVGPNSRVKAAKGCPIAICEYDSNYKPIGFVTGIAGEDGVPADTWLIAKDGEFVEWVA